MPADKLTPHTRAKATPPPTNEPDIVQYINKKLDQQASNNDRRFKVQHDQLLELHKQNNNILTESQNIILENKKLQEHVQQLLAEKEAFKKELEEARVLIQQLQKEKTATDQPQQQQYPLYDENIDYYNDEQGLGHSQHAPSQ